MKSIFRKRKTEIVFQLFRICSARKRKKIKIATLKEKKNGNAPTANNNQAAENTVILFILYKKAANETVESFLQETSKEQIIKGSFVL